MDKIVANAVSLLKSLIAVPSTSRDEGRTADIIGQWLTDHGVTPSRVYNNVWALSSCFSADKPTLMLNSHHDTVKPSPAYSFDPFTPTVRDGKIFGLGSNDAGASLVSLASVFVELKDANLPFNLLFAASAEEEVSGEHGMRALLPELERQGLNIDMAIVGEPTGLQPAIAERGLLVLDCTAHGVTGHAARNEGVNALYKAVDDINTLRSLQFDRVSPTLGPIKITTTMIECGRQHNVVPEVCKFVVDVRTTDAYSNIETVDLIRNAVGCDVQPRSTRIHASVISPDHPLVVAAVGLGKQTFVSPTTSDMALMPAIPSLKIGPGDSSRSHTADEYIYIDEIADGIATYHRLIENIRL